MPILDWGQGRTRSSGGRAFQTKSRQRQGHVGLGPLGYSEHREDGVGEVGWKGPLGRGHILSVL